MSETTKRSAWISLDFPSDTIAQVTGGVTDHHVTVVYLGDDVSDERYAEAVKAARWCAEHLDGPVILEVGGIGCFPAPQGTGKNAWYRRVGDPTGTLELLRSTLAPLDGSSRPTFTPHVTLAYRDPDDSVIFRAEPIQAGIPHLSVHRKGSKTVRFRFGRPQTAAEGPHTAPQTQIRVPVADSGSQALPDGSEGVIGPDPVGKSRAKLLERMTQAERSIDDQRRSLGLEPLNLPETGVPMSQLRREHSSQRPCAYLGDHTAHLWQDGDDVWYPCPGFEDDDKITGRPDHYILNDDHSACECEVGNCEAMSQELFGWSAGPCIKIDHHDGTHLDRDGQRWATVTA